MQADQSAYLHPTRSRLPVPVLTIGEHDFPDVVLEVDHTTDARRRKLPQYEAWGFPEVWIEVPEARAEGRRRCYHPNDRRPGMADNDRPETIRRVVILLDIDGCS